MILGTNYKCKLVIDSLTRYRNLSAVSFKEINRAFAKTLGTSPGESYRVILQYNCVPHQDRQIGGILYNYRSAHMLVYDVTFPCEMRFLRDIYDMQSFMVAEYPTKVHPSEWDHAVALCNVPALLDSYGIQESYKGD